MKNSTLLRLLLLSALLPAAFGAFAQQHPNVKKGFSVDNVYQLGDLDHVNTFNGNLVVQIPLGGAYTAGGSLTYSLSVTYNSKLWDYEGLGVDSFHRPIIRVLPTRRSNAGLGWLLSLGRILDIDHPANKSGGLVYESPDGSEHRIWCTLHPDEEEPYGCDDETTIKANDPGQVQGYTRDGTYLRMRWEDGPGIEAKRVAIEFPDGQQHFFEDDPDNAKKQMRIVEMRDRFGNWVKIEYPNAMTWKITDSSSGTEARKREHYVRFEETPNDEQQTDLNYKTRVRTVEVAQFGTDSRAVYTFLYDDVTSTTRGCVPDEMVKEDRKNGEPRPPKLKTIALPIKDTFYTFQYHDADIDCSSGMLKTLTTPTGSSILYEYQKYEMPSYKCDGSAALNVTPGVERRTVTDPPRGNSAAQVWSYQTKLTGNRTEVCKASLTWPSATYAYPTLMNTTILPTKEKVVRYFSVWPKPDDPQIPEYKRHEYGLPINKDENKIKDHSGLQYYLSTETYDAGGNKVMETYAAYEVDPKAADHPYEPATWDRNRRVKAIGTAYWDDIIDPRNKIPRTAIVRNDDFDGLGHYREVFHGGDFAGSTSRTTFTNYNPGKALPSGTLRPYEPTMPHNATWLLETYTDRTVEENGKVLQTQACFDPVTGFLNARRTFKNTAPGNNGMVAPTENDTLVVFTQKGGSVETEDYYGGDGNNKTSASGCNPGGTRQYQIRHGYTFGVRTSTEHVGSGFLSLDNDVDHYSGLVKRSRDTAGFFTDYTYDSLGRIKTATPQPQQGARFEYTYGFNRDEKWSTVDVKAFGVDGRLVDRRFVTFDGLGRVYRSFDQLPGSPTANTWSVTQTDYDGMNRRSIVYQPDKVVTSNPNNYDATPTYKTIYTYDYLGREKTVTPPDGDAHKVTYTYTGISGMTETVSRANAPSADPNATRTERPTSISRKYDRFGRVHSVTEPAGDTAHDKLKGNDVTTTYTYDPADRLLTVDAGGVQDRTFVYDGRGFLLSEQHPESGLTSYQGYDARGHAEKRINGGNTLTYDYDAAERVEKVTDQSGAVLKQFTFGKATDGNARGKLLTAMRRNDLPSIGRVDVTETYTYDGKFGQVSNRATLVEKVDGGGGRQTIQSFNYKIPSYDDLLLPAEVEMPTCAGCDIPKEAVSSVVNTRTAGHLTEVEGFANLTYHPTGTVETVVHETQQRVVDKYSEKYGIARTTKVQFSSCSDTKPYFLPGAVVAKTNALACGLQITWPPAMSCASGSAVRYKVKRNNIDITNQSGASCLIEPKFIDTTAVQGVEYTYTIIAEGPQVEGGSGGCQNGLTTSITVKGTKQTCDTDTILEIGRVTAYVGIPAAYVATLRTPSGPVQDEELTFVINGQNRGKVRTGPNGTAVIQHSLDLEPKKYENAFKVIYEGGVLPPETVTADINLFCGFPSYIVNPLALNVPPDARTYPVLVGTSRHCTWNPSPANAGFVTVDTAPRKGPGAFTFDVTQHSGAQSRTARIPVALKEVLVTQSGSGCSYGFDPAIAYVPAESQSGVVSMNISTTSNCSWSVSKDSSAGWLRFQPAPSDHPNDPPRTSGTGPGTIYFKVDPQHEPSKRVATLTLVDDKGQFGATGSVNQNAPLPAVPPGSIQEDLRDGSVANGSNVNLRVWVNEGTQLEYAWFINDVPIYPSCKSCDSMTLHPGDNGYPAANQSSTFQVRVFNNRGEVSSKKVTWHNNGTVSTPQCPNGKVPTLYEGPFRPADAPIDRFSPSPGSNVTLWVTADTRGTATYEWYRGISGDEGSKIPPDPNLPPTDIRVNPFSTSFYWVKVTDDCGSNFSRSAKVTVTRGPAGRRRACCTMDITGDGFSDIPWHNTATGQNEVWAMSGNGTTRGNTYQLQRHNDGGAQLQSAGDLDADGNVDLMWRNPATGKNEVWLMNRTSLSDIVEIEARAGTEWTIGAISDFDQDDHDDIVWHNSATGANEIWFGEGTDHLGTWALPNSGPSTGVYGKGDFNGDEKPDLFFHNRDTGQNQIWIMDEGSRVGITSNADSASTSSPAGPRMLKVATLAVPPATNSDLVPALVADMNRDGKPDIVWRNSVTGENSVWLMNGSQVTSDVALETRSDLNWQIGGGGNGTSPGSGGGTTPPGQTATSLSVSVDPAAVGQPTAVTATLVADGSPVASRNLVFSVGGTEVMRLLTGADGVATAVINTAGRAAGTYVGAVTVRFEGDSTYAASSKSADLVISSESAVVTWNEPAPIVFGTPLSATQLNASASVPGTFVYTPPAGAVLDAGYQTLSVTFTPADPSIAPITQMTVVLVNKAPSAVSWQAPSAIAYGTPLSGRQLNATSSLAGTFEYVPAQGTILGVGAAHTLQVTFEPADPNYAISTATTTIQVEKGTQVVLWSDPAPISALEPLGAAQFNATIIPSGSAPAGQVTYNPPAGTVLPPGVHELRVSVAATAEYEAAGATVDIVVTNVKPTLQWNQPAAIVYGTALSAAQLNATADVPGTFAYSHEIGTYLEAGTHTLSAIFTPADSRYEQAEAEVTIEVARAQQTIVWSNPAGIVYGTPLGDPQLNATVQVPGPAQHGNIYYTPISGTVLPAGTRTLTVTVDATANYESATRSVTIEVAKAAPVLTWAAPATIVYGTPLTSTQLNATSNVPGTFVYTPAAGTILNAGAGQTLSVQFTPNDGANHTTAAATVTITVTKAVQTLAWNAPAPIVYGTPLSAAQLNATATVVGPAPAGALTYDPAAGTVLQAGNAQVLSVSAAETANYQPATLTTTIDVLKARPVLAWATPAPVVYRTALSATQLNATSNVAGAFVYAPAAGTVLDAGMQPLKAHFTPTDTRNYEEGDIAVTLEVQQAVPILTWPKPAQIVYGTKLGEAQLNTTADVPGTFVYTPAAGTILNAGTGHELSVQFTPTDTRNFTNATASVTIDVAKAPQKLTWTTPAAIVYGTPLSSTQLGAEVTVVGPSPAGALVYTPPAGRVLDAGTHTLTVNALETANYEPATLSVSLEVRRKALSLVVDPKSKLYGAPVPVLTGTLTGVVNNDPIAPSYATTGTQASPAGTYPITGSLIDSNNRLPNYDVTITPSTLTVLPAPLSIAANPASKQYSDPLPTLGATFTGFVLGETPAVLSGTLVIQAAADPLSAPGTYPISIGGLASPNYAITYVGSTLTVTAEDARVLITAPLAVSASSSGATAVTLIATIQDISVTADAAGDTYPGDIRKATLTFVDRATQAQLCTATIGLVHPDEQRTGIATCTFTRDFGAVLPATLTVGAQIGGYYTRDAAAEDVKVVVSAQTPDQINGAGSVKVAAAAGSHAPDAGSDAKFTILSSYDKNGLVKGHFTFNFSRTENGVVKKYEVAAAVISSLSITRTNPGGAAVLIGTGTLTDTSARTQIATGVPLIVTAADKRDRDVKDQLSVTMLKSDGGLWLAAGWTGVQPVELPLEHGQIQVEEKK